MKKSISFHLLPVLVMLLCLSSCSETTKKTEYTHSIPSNVTEMASLYYPSLYQVSLLDQSNHFFEYIMKYGNFVSGASTYYKKEIFDKYGLFDEKYKLLEDYPFYVNLAFNNEKIGYHVISFIGPPPCSSAL